MQLLQVMKAKVPGIRADIWRVGELFRVDKAEAGTSMSSFHASVDAAVEDAEVFVFSAEFCATH